MEIVGKSQCEGEGNFQELVFRFSNHGNSLTMSTADA